MEENNYNKLNRPKIFKHVSVAHDLASSKSLEELLVESEKGHYLDSNDLFKAYCVDLKNILKSSEIKESLERFFKLEEIIENIELSNDFNENLPSLLVFHKNFSSTALRIFWECVAGDDLDSLANRFLDAFRIALEEELYIWQEKIH